MRRTSGRHLDAFYDAVLLLVYGACGLIALFTPPGDQTLLATGGRILIAGQTGPAAAARVLSAVGLTLVLIVRIWRPAARLGWRRRDVGLAGFVLLAVMESYRAPIRHVALLDLLFVFHLASIFVISAYLFARRPQPLITLTVVLLLSATGLVWRRGDVLFPAMDPARMTQVTALAALAALPWLAVRLARRWRHKYHWVVLAAVVIVLTIEATALTPGSRAGWEDLFADALQTETRQAIPFGAGTPWLWGYGPGHFAWIERANVPADLAARGDSMPGILPVFAERGAIGLAALALFALAMLWRFRPGAWAEHRPEVLASARPLRWVAGYVFLLLLATPLGQAPFALVVFWSLVGMLRAMSAEQSPAAVALFVDEGRRDGDASEALPESWPGQQRARTALLTAALLAGSGLVVLHLRPWIAQRYLRASSIEAFQDIAFFERVEMSRLWWPHDPQNYKFEAVHYRARATAQARLTQTVIDATTRAYERMVRANPYDALAHHELARWFIDLEVKWKKSADGLKKAIEATRRGLLFCPASFELQYLLAGCYRTAGDFANARNAYQRARRWRPDSVPVLLNLAEVETQLGQMTEAQRYLRLAHQIARDKQPIEAALDAIRPKRVDPRIDSPRAEPDAPPEPIIPPVSRTP